MEPPKPLEDAFSKVLMEKGVHMDMDVRNFLLENLDVDKINQRIYD